MKDWIITSLGGYTQEEYDSMKHSFKRKLEEAKKLAFREGDKVYINSVRFDKDSYYLLEPYNNNTHWYVSVDPNDTLRRGLVNGVSIENISHEPFDYCKFCNKKK